jgi:ABC-type multidrug transport system permease subunit
MEADEVIAVIIAFGLVFWAMYLQAVLNKVGESMLWFWLAMAIFWGQG